MKFPVSFWIKTAGKGSTDLPTCEAKLCRTNTHLGCKLGTQILIVKTHLGLIHSEKWTYWGAQFPSSVSQPKSKLGPFCCPFLPSHVLTLLELCLIILLLFLLTAHIIHQHLPLFGGCFGRRLPLLTNVFVIFLLILAVLCRKRPQIVSAEHRAPVSGQNRGREFIRGLKHWITVRIIQPHHHLLYSPNKDPLQ